MAKKRPYFTGGGAMRLRSIDTLRGIAALGVVIFHLFGGFDHGNIIAEYGRVGVFLFFVISGFCIHLRFAKGKEPEFIAFWKRRWIRLYPAYIASMFLYFWWAQASWFSIYDVLMHLLMLHNWDIKTVYSMNGVWWTLAIEEQLYLLYFVLLMVRKRWGWVITLLITLASRFVILGISLALHRAGVYELPFNESAFANWWLWALGAVAVEAYSQRIKLPAVLYSIYFAGAVLLSNAGFYYIAAFNPGTIESEAAAAISPVMWGVGFFVLINWAVRNDIGNRALAFVGLFSYSLYLTHEVVIKALDVNVIVTGAACIAFAYGFFRLFEKPFMRSAAPIRINELSAEA